MLQAGSSRLDAVSRVFGARVAKELVPIAAHGGDTARLPGGRREGEGKGVAGGGEPDGAQRIIFIFIFSPALPASFISV